MSPPSASAVALEDPPVVPDSRDRLPASVGVVTCSVSSALFLRHVWPSVSRRPRLDQALLPHVSVCLYHPDPLGDDRFFFFQKVCQAVLPAGRCPHLTLEPHSPAAGRAEMGLSVMSQSLGTRECWGQRGLADGQCRKGEGCLLILSWSFPRPQCHVLRALGMEVLVPLVKAS